MRCPDYECDVKYASFQGIPSDTPSTLLRRVAYWLEDWDIPNPPVLKFDRDSGGCWTLSVFCDPLEDI
jgi:hypothetical protein